MMNPDDFVMEELGDRHACDVSVKIKKTGAAVSAKCQERIDQLLVVMERKAKEAHELAKTQLTKIEDLSEAEVNNYFSNTKGEVADKIQRMRGEASQIRRCIAGLVVLSRNVRPDVEYDFFVSELRFLGF